MFDLATPIRYEHPLSQGLQFFGLALPGLGGGKKVWNLCDLHRVAGRHGTLTGTYNPPYAPGGIGWQYGFRAGGWGQISMTGLSSDVEIADTPSLKLVTQFTVAFSFYWKTVQNGTIMTKGAGGSAMAMIRLFGSDTGLYITQGGVNHMNVTITARKHLHIALVSKVSGSLLYIDGQQKDTGISLTTWWNTTDPIRIGQGLGTYFSGSEASFFGSIDAIMLYNRSLAPSEVKLLAQEMPLTFPSLIRRVGGQGIQRGQSPQSAFYYNWRRRVA